MSAPASSAESSTLADLQPDAFDPFNNDIGTVSMAVLANPAKLAPNILPLSEGVPPPVAQDEQAESEVLIDEADRMHFSDVSQTTDEILMGKMESAGFHPGGGGGGGGGLDTTFHNIGGAASTMAAQFDPFAQSHQTPAQDEQDLNPYENRFTAPQKELEASGVASDNLFEDNGSRSGSRGDGSNDRTQRVRINLDNNAVNTFDASVFRTHGGGSMRQGRDSERDESDRDSDSRHRRRRHSRRDRRHRRRHHGDVEDDDSSESSDSESDDDSASQTPTESDATAFEQQQREHSRQRRKVEGRRRRRLPHERTVGEQHAERFEDWEREVQQNVQKEVNNEKRELLLMFAEREQEGFKMLRTFNMQSDLNEMRWWYYKLLRDARTDDEVAQMRSHMVEGTRMLLFINDNLLNNPLGLSNMNDFPEQLSAMLVGTWDRHLRDHVKQQHTLQGPPAQPLKNLTINFMHLLISHHRKKAAEEQKEKQEQEAAQRSAMLAAHSGSASPFEMIFGKKTSLMRDSAGINNISVPSPAIDPDYAEFLRYKQTNDPEYQRFLRFKAGASGAANSAPQTPPVPRAFLSGGGAPSFGTQLGSSIPSNMRPPDIASLNNSTVSAAASRPDFRLPAGSHRSTLTTQSNAPQVAAEASVTRSNSRPVGNNNSQNATSGSHTSSKRVPTRSQPQADASLLLSTSDAGHSESTENSMADAAEAAAAAAAAAAQRSNADRPPTPSSSMTHRTLSPPTRRSASEITRSTTVSQLQQQLMEKSGHNLPAGPDVSREQILQLQRRIATAAKARDQQRPNEPARAATPTRRIVLRPSDQQKLKNLLRTPRARASPTPMQSAVAPKKLQPTQPPPRPRAVERAPLAATPIDFAHDRRFRAPTPSQSQSNSVTEDSATASVTLGDYNTSVEESHDAQSDAALLTSESTSVGSRVPTPAPAQPAAADEDEDFEAMLARMEKECAELEDDDEEYNDVAVLPIGAKHMDSQSDANRLIGMLNMFKSLMETPKGTRPQQQSNMFGDIDSLLAVGDDATNDEFEFSSSSSRSSRSSQRRKKKNRTAKRRASASSRSSASASSAVSHDSLNGSGLASSTSFHASQAGFEDMLDSRGNMTF